MTFLECAQKGWTLVVSPTLPTPFNYVPLAFRLLAMMIAAPFVLFIALELVAYLITRTLHISMSNLRVPRSPPPGPTDLPSDKIGAEDEISSQLGAPYPTPAPDSSPTSMKGQPFARAFGAAAPSPAAAATTGALVLIAALVGLAATAFHVIVSRANEATALALAGGIAAPKVVVLTAHPDDEAMFFAPSVLNLLAAGWTVLPICVSTGNAVGLGGIRAAELVESYARLGVKDPIVLDNPELPDSMGPEGAWDPALVAELVAPYIQEWDVTHLLTFDDAGVTEHPNHVALASVHSHLVSLSNSSPDSKGSPPLQNLKLYSPPLSTKFTGVWWAIFIASRDALRREPPHHATFVATPQQYVTALYAMRAHVSQLVWFRWLYVAFSRLMWVNQIEQ